MLRNTDFLTVLPRYALRHSAENSQLAELPVQLTLSSASVGMVSPKNRLESPLFAAFAAHMRDYVAKDLPTLQRATPKY